jgi:hypothetical protein
LKGKTPNEKIENVTKFRMNPMKYRVSAECSKLIRNILKVDPKERPTIKEILGSVYVLQMSQKFNWDLKKLLKFRKMKNNNLQASMISGMSYNTTNTSQSDSFYFDKRMSGFTSLIEGNNNSTDQNSLISGLSGKKLNIVKPSISSPKIISNDGQVLNFEKKNANNEENIFKKETPNRKSKEDQESSNKKDLNVFISPPEMCSNDIKLNVFSQKNSDEKHNIVTSQHISQNISQIRGKSFQLFY